MHKHYGSFSKRTRVRESERKAKSLDSDVMNVMNFYLAKSPQRKRMAMAVGGFREVRQEASVLVLKTRTDVWDSYKWTTVVCNCVKWALLHMQGRCSVLERAKLNDLRLKNEALFEERFRPFYLQTFSVDNELPKWLYELMRSELNSRSRDILLSISNGDRRSEIARNWGVTVERISQLEKKAIRKLQHKSAIVITEYSRTVLDEP